jgi:hypothetical protein
MWKSPPYTLYLRNGSETVLARQEINVDSDTEAATVAAVLHDACSDMVQRSEIWRGAHQVPETALPEPVPTAHQVNARLQQIILEREIALRDSRWQVAESRRLLQRINAWHSGMAVA